MDKYFILFIYNFLNIELNLLIIILYIFKNFKLSSLRNKSNYNNFKNNFCDNSEYIFDININEKSCKDLNYSKFTLIFTAASFISAATICASFKSLSL